MEYCPMGAIYNEEIDLEINEDRIETLAIIKWRFPDPETLDILNLDK